MRGAVGTVEADAGCGVGEGAVEEVGCETGVGADEEGEPGVCGFLVGGRGRGGCWRDGSGGEDGEGVGFVGGDGGDG